MVTEKICDNCNVRTKTSLNDLADIGWSAFQIPTGSGEIYCFCPNCQESMRKKMVENIKNYNAKSKTPPLSEAKTNSS